MGPLGPFPDEPKTKPKLDDVTETEGQDDVAADQDISDFIDCDLNPEQLSEAEYKNYLRFCGVADLQAESLDVDPDVGQVIIFTIPLFEQLVDLNIAQVMFGIQDACQTSQTQCHRAFDKGMQTLLGYGDQAYSEEVFEDASRYYGTAYAYTRLYTPVSDQAALGIVRSEAQIAKLAQENGNTDLAMERYFTVLQISHLNRLPDYYYLAALEILKMALDAYETTALALLDENDPAVILELGGILDGYSQYIIPFIKSAKKTDREQFAIDSPEIKFGLELLYKEIAGVIVQNPPHAKQLQALRKEVTKLLRKIK